MRYYRWDFSELVLITQVDILIMSTPPATPLNLDPAPDRPQDTETETQDTETAMSIDVHLGPGRVTLSSFVEHQLYWTRTFRLKHKTERDELVAVARTCPRVWPGLIDGYIEAHPQGSELDEDDFQAFVDFLHDQPHHDRWGCRILMFVDREGNITHLDYDDA